MNASRLNSKNSGPRKREWSALANASNDCWIEWKDDLHHLFLIELQRTARPVFGSVDGVPHQDAAKLFVDSGLLHAILEGMAERIDDVLLRREKLVLTEILSGCTREIVFVLLVARESIWEFLHDFECNADERYAPDPRHGLYLARIFGVKPRFDKDVRNCVAELDDVFVQVANLPAPRTGLAEHQHDAARFSVHAGECAEFEYLVTHPLDRERRPRSFEFFTKGKAIERILPVDVSEVLEVFLVENPHVSHTAFTQGGGSLFTAVCWREAFDPVLIELPGVVSRDVNP